MQEYLLCKLNIHSYVHNDDSKPPMVGLYVWLSSFLYFVHTPCYTISTAFADDAPQEYFITVSSWLLSAQIHAYPSQRGDRLRSIPAQKD